MRGVDVAVGVTYRGNSMHRPYVLVSMVTSMVASGVLALAACGGPKGPAQPTISTAECAAAGQNTARLLTAEVPDVPAATIADLGAALERHCKDDGWSEDAQACIATATDTTSMDACDPLLTQAQKDAAGKELGEIASRAMGSMGGASYGGATYGAPIAD